MSGEINNVEGEQALSTLDGDSSFANNTVARGATIIVMALACFGAMAYGATKVLGDDDIEVVEDAPKYSAVSSVPDKEFMRNVFSPPPPITEPVEKELEIVVVSKEEPVVPPIKNFFSEPPKLASVIATPPKPDIPTTEAPKMMLDKSRSALMVASDLPVKPNVVEILAQYQPIDGNREEDVVSVTDELGRPVNNSGYRQNNQRGINRTQNSRAQVASRRMNNFVLSKGSYIDCVLNTQLNSQLAGITKCQVLHNVYSDSGDVLLIERGSVLTGEYRSVTQQGINRVMVLWTRIRTPEDVLIDIDSQATDPVGGTGIPGYLNNYIWKRFAGAFMLSLVMDGIEVGKAQAGVTPVSNSDGESASETTSISILEAVLSLYGNIQPTIEVDRGSRVGILVARDLDFSDVYSLVNE